MTTATPTRTSTAELLSARSDLEFSGSVLSGSAQHPNSPKDRDGWCGSDHSGRQISLDHIRSCQRSRSAWCGSDRSGRQISLGREFDFVQIIMTDKSELVGIVVDKVNLIRRISNIEQLPGESHTFFSYW
jgi:hypothetical protein